ncbi:chaplin [Streptomyces sp. TR06-5]|uniref:chaplin n=1 Tax=Streptomyces sp. TR06-5 TaxID=3385976 RepID=UPI0039A15184
MRQVTRKGLITVAAAGGVLALSGGAAFADATATGAAEGSPGVASGNTVQVPVNVPVNACGNTVDAVGLLNPAFGNTCVNDGGHERARHHEDQGGGEQQQGGGHQGQHQEGGHQQTGGSHQGHHGGGSTAEGVTEGSPGVGSGNQTQVPVDVPVNLCGNSVDVVGLLNPAFGNECVNESGRHWEPPVETPEEPEKETPEQPDAPEKPVTPETQTVTQPELAQTGADYGLETSLGMGASLLLGGSILYRRARALRR